MKPLFPTPEEQDHNAPPLNPLPVSVIVLALVIFGIEVVLLLGQTGLIGGQGAIGWRLELLQRFGFSSQHLRVMWEHQSFIPNFAVHMVSYAFVHHNFTHAVFVLVFLLSLGKMVGEVLSNFAVLLVFFGSTFAGALAYGLVWESGPGLIGGFPAAYGLVGAFTLILFAGLGPKKVGAMQAFLLIAFLLGLQLVFGLVAFLFGSEDMSSWDWPARLAGFVGGFGLAFLVSPGGWQAILRKLRTR